MPRKYQQKKRAEATTETRHKIVRAVVELHGTLGPASTTISAIAERAGVRRATVYEHFPDERSIFEACTAHFFSDHPPPNHSHWASISSPAERLKLALTDTYAYYERTEHMLSLVYRDAELKPVMWEVEAAQRQARHWQEAFEVLLAPWSSTKDLNPLLIAALRHALNFQTWRELVREQGLDAQQAVELMTKLARCCSSDE